MQSTFLKQLAYNQRVLEAKKEVAGINCDVADFLSGMSVDPDDQVVICVNASEEMKRNGNWRPTLDARRPSNDGIQCCS
jgi:hypothetical protein